MSSTPNLPDNFKPKSFWERPEGTTGMIFAAAAIIGGGVLLYKLLPYLIELATNIVHLTIMGIVATILLYVAFDKRFWNLLSYFYKSVMRAITRLFIEIDPIGILNNYADDLKSSLTKMDKNLATLAGQIRQCENLIQSNEREKNQALQMSKLAHEKGKKTVFALQARQAGRLQNSNMTLQTLLTKMQVLQKVLAKMLEVSDVMIQDIESEIDVKSRERAMILASHSALQSALKILRGDQDKKAMFDMAMDYLTEDYGAKLGEIEHFVQMSGAFIDTVDMQNGIFEADALKMIEEWEQKSDSLLLGDEKRLLLEHKDFIQAPSANVPNPGEYSQLFDKT